MRRFLFLAALVLALTVPEPARAATLNDPALQQGLQWGVTTIGAPQAWDRATGKGITIAVVDSGIDLKHADLKGHLVASTACFDTDGDPRNCRGSAQDDHGHGTHVSGIAAAVSNNGQGVAGVAPGADLMAVRVLERTCDALGCDATGRSDDVSAGIRWAVDNGADVINLSLGSTTSAVLGPSFADAISYAWKNGVIAVVAAGNDFILSSGFADEPAIVVSATDREDREASYSNGVGSARWAIAAPGGESGDSTASCATGGKPRGVISTFWDPDLGPNAYACLAGTSMAAPHVSGAAAVLRSLGLTPQQTVDRLLSTAKDLGPRGRDGTFGAGRLDLAEAVGGAKPPTSTTSTTARPSSTTAPPTTLPTTGTGSRSGTGTAADLDGTTTSTTTDADGDGDGVRPTIPDQVDEPEDALTVEINPDEGGGDDVPVAVVLLAAAMLLGSAGATAAVALRGTGRSPLG